MFQKQSIQLIHESIKFLIIETIKMYHSLDFFDLLQLDLKLHSIFPTFMETKSLITIQNRGKEKELDKNKS